LGQGGFGKTFLVEDTQSKTRQQYVLKQFSPQTTDDTSYQLAQERFQNEATVLLELSRKHRQIPKIFGYFFHDEDFYLIIEYIEGATLTQRVRDQGPLPPPFVIQTLQDILQILEVVHSEKIIHRDIKPDNVIIRASDHKPVLIDFGAVKECLHTLMQGQYAATSIVIGSPGYIAPEQAAGRPGYFSDIYSLGMTAIYMLTGKSVKDLQNQFHSYNLDWQHHAPNLPSELASVIDKAIQLHPSERYATAIQMRQALPALTSTPATLMHVNEVGADAQEPAPFPPLPNLSQPLTHSPATVAIGTQPVLPAVKITLATPSGNPTQIVPVSTGFSTAKKPIWGWVLGAAVACGVLIIGLSGIYVYRNRLITTTVTTTTTTPASTAVDESAAITLLEDLYAHLSNQDYEAAKELFAPRLVKQFDPNFFQKFRRVTIDNVRITSQTNTSLNFIGDTTYVWPDGSTQREQRSFTIRNIEGKLKITASEFIRVLERRGTTQR
jgi:serine/threonine protein kinase